MDEIQFVFVGFSFLHNLLVVSLHISEVWLSSHGLVDETLSSLSISVLSYLYETNRSTEALSLHIADIRKSGNYHSSSSLPSSQVHQICANVRGLIWLKLSFFR